MITRAHVDRMKDEFCQLQERWRELENFLNTQDQLDAVEYTLMTKQLDTMRTYAEILHGVIVYAKENDKNTGLVNEHSMCDAC